MFVNDQVKMNTIKSGYESISFEARIYLIPICFIVHLSSLNIRAIRNINIKLNIGVL